MENGYKEKVNLAETLFAKAKEEAKACLAIAKANYKKALADEKKAEKNYWAADKSGADDDECDYLADLYSQCIETTRYWSNEIEKFEDLI